MTTIKKKCLVKGCQNTSNAGEFIGDLCGPCHQMITTGFVHHANITFIGDLQRKVGVVAEIKRLLTKV